MTSPPTRGPREQKCRLGVPKWLQATTAPMAEFILLAVTAARSTQYPLLGNMTQSRTLSPRRRIFHIRMVALRLALSTAICTWLGAMVISISGLAAGAFPAYFGTTTSRPTPEPQGRGRQ